MKSTTSKAKKPKPLSAAELRRQAEVQLKVAKLKSVTIPIGEVEVRKLVHELQVHQIELEMQNEELIQSRAEVETALQQYTELYDFAPVGYCTLTSNGTIKRINFAGALLLGLVRGQIFNRRLGLFVSQKHRPIFNATLAKVFDQHRKASCEVEVTKDNSTIPHWVNIEVSVSDNGQEGYLVLSDISERKKAEITAREATNAREILIQNLQFALDNKKTFHGILPICATCKKIREDKGSWTQIEAYITSHTNVNFTHGICPDCAKKFFESPI